MQIGRHHLHGGTEAQVPREAQTYLDRHSKRIHGALMERLRSSVKAHQCYTTVRRGDSPWIESGTGVKTKVLRFDEHFSVELWRMGSGKAIRWPAGTLAMEILVVEGTLRHGEADDAPELPVQGFLVSEAPDELGEWTAALPTTIYVRRRVAPLEALHPLEAHWWRLAAKHPGASEPRTWIPTTPGAHVMPLCGDKQVTSMLVRFDAGASVCDHSHALDEDCLVLEGDMFLGDILLRAGDYQLAPTGSSHFGEMSDCGVTFYFHGALDPVLFLF